MATPERLQKLLARAGLMSRRQAEALLLARRISINGFTAQPGDRAVAGEDRICVDGTTLPIPHVHEQLPRRTLLLHKPRGVISTCRDTHGRQTVLDLLPAETRRGLYPVGRLDLDSEGALLLSNDGDLVLRLTHPRYGHSKTYRVWIKGSPTPQCLQRWRNGVRLDRCITRPATVVLEQVAGNRQCSRLQIVIQEGRYRQIRRIAHQLGHPVLRLQRLSVGTVQLGSLAYGGWRWLEPHEIDRLNRAASLPAGHTSPSARCER